MRRVLVIVLTFVLTVGASAWLILDDWNVAAWNAGQKVYYYRNLFRVATKRKAPPAVPLVVWMGDSTITNIPRPSYPQYLAPRFSSRHIASQVVAAPAFDFFTYYFLMGPVLDMHPDVIVMVAHLAAFPTKVGTRFTYNDLCSFIPAEALPGTMVLPLAPRRLSPARVLLARVLRTTLGEDGFYVAEGLRSLWGDAPAWDVLGPKQPPPIIDWRRMITVVKAYDFPITRRNPTLRMMEATVRLAMSRGTHVIVIGSPIPYEELRKEWWYDSDAWSKRYAVLRAAVEEAGGTFLDMHEAMTTDGFADAGGHFNDTGANRMANILQPVVTQAVEAAWDGHDRAGR